MASKKSEVDTAVEKALDDIDTDPTTGGALSVSSDGVLAPSAQVADFLIQGFSEERVIKIGNPEKQGVIAYIGQLIGPGPDIELNKLASAKRDDELPQAIPTWAFNPIDPKTLQPIEQITHVVLCPNQLDAACKRLMALKQTRGGEIIAFIKWDGMGQNRLGQPLNKYRVAHKSIPSKKVIDVEPAA